MPGVTLDTIGGGALAELFELELSRILANITDPNTDAQAKRVISIAIAFKPNRDRDVVNLAVACASKLAGVRTVEAQVFLGRVKGKLVAVEHDPRQLSLFDAERSGLSAVEKFPSPDKDGGS